jgi:hypothetical protein
LSYLKTRVDVCQVTNEQEVEELMEVLQCTMDILHEQRWDREVEQKKNEVYRLQQRLIQAIRDHQPPPPEPEPEPIVVEPEVVPEPAIVVEPMKRRSTWGFASFGEYDSDD